MTVGTIGEILSDVDLYCKIIFKGNIKYPKASKISSNSVNCELSIQNLSLNTELIRVSLFLNDSFSNIEISNNLTYVFLKEPISITGVPKTISKDDYFKNFTLQMDDLRTSEFVSFSNYSVELIPEFHSKMDLNCFYEKNSPYCSIPQLQLNSVPVKLNLYLNVFSSLNFTNKIQIQIEPLYHKENVTVKQSFPYLLDLESYTSNSVKIVFNSSKPLISSYSYYCQCILIYFNIPKMMELPQMQL
jgi:hypothetical protein